MAAPFDLAAFRAEFPAFADTALYPDAMVLRWSEMAACSLSEGCALNGDCYALAWQLLTAHIGTTLTRAAAGTGSGIVNAASIDKVSVSYAPPPYRSGWAYWLAQTPYGQQLQGMLSVKATGGFYLGGTALPERNGFRGPGGLYVRY